MFRTLRDIIRDNWEWRGQTWRLAMTELRKEVRGTVLGWVWLLLTPAIYLAVFWFALAIGLRNRSPVDGVPFIVWLAAGIVPWFFMSRMLGGGSDVYHRYSYLVNKLRFPISVISSFFALAKFIVFLMSMLLVFALMVGFRIPLTIYALQLPVVAIVMYLFWTLWSMATSPLSALSRDFHNLVKALSTPLFWVSGIIFRVDNIEIEWVQRLYRVNPITFFATSMRASLCEHFWMWDRPDLLWPFVAVFFVMLVAAVLIQTRLRTEIADVL
ncbi:MAG: ABC transporter permease [Propionibacteriaceae bacterium]|jgi:teichoic acid transport system permease protein|nr:ABC transporter permease [Propionibacteriaceae bacterium]